MWRAWSVDWGQVYAVANDLKQADSRVGYYMRRAVDLYPPFRGLIRKSNYRLEFPNHAFIESIPIDPSGEAGSNADCVVFSELWGAHEIPQQRMWSEMTTPPGKFGRAFRWVETYAGFSGESILLEMLYETGVKNGDWIDLGFSDLPVFVNAKARMLCLWNDRPRLPWQSKEYYSEQEATLLPNEFLRIHRNQWVSSSEKFVPEEWWAQCHFTAHGLNKHPDPVEREPWVIGIDAGISNDHFGIVGWTKLKDRLVLRYVREWIPPKRGKILFSNPANPLDPETPEGELRRLAKAHNVLEFAYDETQMHDLASRLRRSGVGYFRPFPQGIGTLRTPGRPISDKQFYDVIQQRRIIHDGNSVLTAHVSNADALIEGDNRERVRMVKRSDQLKIDTAVASSMSISELLRLNIS